VYKAFLKYRKNNWNCSPAGPLRFRIGGGDFIETHWTPGTPTRNISVQRNVLLGYMLSKVIIFRNIKLTLTVTSELHIPISFGTTGHPLTYISQPGAMLSRTCRHDTRICLVTRDTKSYTTYLGLTPLHDPTKITSQHRLYVGWLYMEIPRDGWITFRFVQFEFNTINQLTK